MARQLHRLLIAKGENGEPDRYRVGAVPWFGLRLRTGNSLVGTRRAVWTAEQLQNGDHFGKDAAAPRTMKPGEARKENEIYHFLVWDEDMAPAARDTLMKSHWQRECDLINSWNSEQVKSKWPEEDVKAGLAISTRIDDLWAQYARDRAEALQKSACTASVWPTSSGAEEALKPGPTLEQQEQTRATLEATSGSFQRLKLIMDAWCAFYFWPLERCEDLPTRDAWLAACQILTGVAMGNAEARAMLTLKLGFEVEELFRATQDKLPDVLQLAQAMPCLKLGADIADDQHFHHWELVFTEVLGPDVEGLLAPKGFDLIAGNPPWIKVGWNDAPLLAEFQPLLGVREAKSAKLDEVRPKLLHEKTNRIEYRRQFEVGEGNSVFLNDRSLFPALSGLQTNIYKNFIERSWSLLNDHGISGLIHPDGVFDDPKGGIFREEYYRRLLAHYQFENQFTLFVGTNDHGRLRFSINVYCGQRADADFSAIFNLYTPDTIAACRNHTGSADPLPGIKTDGGAWETRGHCQRILTVNSDTLALFARLFEKPDAPAEQAKLPQVHGTPLLAVLEKVSRAQRRLGSIEGNYYPTEMFHELNRQRDGVITRTETPTLEPSTAEELVISGPLIHIGRPWNKTPRTTCTQNNDYDEVDLTEIPDEFLPRAVYRPGDQNGDLTAFHDKIAEWPEPSLPGFWPIDQEDQASWELLVGEELCLYGIDSNLPGARTRRRFAFFSRAEGPIHEAIDYLRFGLAKDDFTEFTEKFASVVLCQARPSPDELMHLPKPITSYYRHIHRRKAKPSDFRTLISTIIPNGPTHIHPVISMSFTRNDSVLEFQSITQSLIADFIIRIAGKEDIYESALATLPLAETWKTERIGRTLRLVCVTSDYAQLWQEQFTSAFRCDEWTTTDSRLMHEHELRWSDLTAEWQRGCALRSDFARRQALLEIDALVALALGLTLDELLLVYRVQFPVMRQYERADLYDAKGRRVPNTKRKDPGAKELREALKLHDGVVPLTVSWKINNGERIVTKTFHPPFTPVDREEDYRIAYEVFSQRLRNASAEPIGLAPIPAMVA